MEKKNKSKNLRSGLLIKTACVFVLLIILILASIIGMKSEVSSFFERIQSINADIINSSGKILSQTNKKVKELELMTLFNKINSVADQ